MIPQYRYVVCRSVPKTKTVPMLNPTGLQIESALLMWGLYCPDKVYIVYLESTDSTWTLTGVYFQKVKILISHSTHISDFGILLPRLQVSFELKYIYLH